MASNPVAAAVQPTQPAAEDQATLQVQATTSKVSLGNPVQDTVTLSNGAFQPTSAEEAGLFHVATPPFSAFPAIAPTASYGPNSGSATDTREATLRILVPQNNQTSQPPATPANNAPVVKIGGTQAANTPPAGNSDPPALHAGDAAAANTATQPAAPAAHNVAQANLGAAAGVAPAPAPAPAAANEAANAANTAAITAAQATNTAPAAQTSTQVQNLLLQFTQYLQQLGLPAAARNQMLDAAQILNGLNPPAFQQAIVALRAEAASLAAQAGSASQAAPTANSGANAATALAGAANTANAGAAATAKPGLNANGASAPAELAAPNETPSAAQK